MKGAVIWIKPEGAAEPLKALRIEYRGRTYYRTLVPVDRHREFGREDRIEVGAVIKDEGVLVPQDVVEAIAAAVEARYRQRVVEAFLGDNLEMFDIPRNVGDAHNWMVDERPAPEPVGFD